MDVLWGWGMIAIGLVVAAFGTRFVRLGIALIGFCVGFLLVFAIMGDQGSVQSVLISIAAGAVGAILCLALFRYVAYLAGAALGVAVALLLTSAIGMSQGGAVSQTLAIIIAIAAAIGGGIIGPMMGRNAMLLAASGLGAIMMVAGLNQMYASKLGGTETSQLLAGSVNVTLFIILFLLSCLGQVDFKGFGRERA